MNQPIPAWLHLKDGAYGTAGPRREIWKGGVDVFELGPTARDRRKKHRRR